MSQIENFIEVAKDEREQLLEKNKRISNILDTMQEKYSSTLKKLIIIQIKILKI